MTLREAIAVFREHQRNSVREKTRESYAHPFRNLEALLGDAVLPTARLRYAQVKAL